MKPRLHVLFARDGKNAVVLRRGPSKEVASIAWNRDKDTFTLGQWLRGRIYERRSDLSPDGQYLIYFAMNGHWGNRGKGAWTAISVAPYLTAIALFAKGDCWHDGGLFVGRDSYWLNNGYGHEVVEQTSRVTRAPATAVRVEFGGECMGVYIPRLQRDGWTLRYDLTDADAIVLDKALWHGWVLRKYARGQAGPPPGKSVYFDEHELVHPERGVTLDRKDWEWADVDRGRLVWAEAGALWAGIMTKHTAAKDDPFSAITQLHDFSPMKFEAVPAPYSRTPAAKTSRRAARRTR